MSTPWQLQIYKKSLKKRKKIAAIEDYIGDLKNKKCLEIGCEKGVTSYFLRRKGGRWISTDIDKENVKITKELIKKNVLYFKEDALPFLDSSFDYIIAIDTLEHIENDESFLRDIYRILSKNGTLCITVPCSKETLVLNRVAKKIGLTNEYYGHKREGYTIETLRDKLELTDFHVQRYKYFSKFFTESIELFINFFYVFILNKGFMKKGIKGSISPSSKKDLNTHAGSFKLYTLIYPIFRLISYLDKLNLSPNGYCLILLAKKISHKRK